MDLRAVGEICRGRISVAGVAEVAGVAGVAEVAGVTGVAEVTGVAGEAAEEA